MHGNSTRRLVMASGGDQVVGHVGLHALGAFADRLGLGNALSSRIPPRGERMPLHDRGKVLVQSMLMLAGGGESCADIEHLGAQEDLFGQTPSDSTVFRTFHEITPQTRDALAEAFAGVRAEVWRRSVSTKGTAPVILDIDASLVEIHTETKEGTGPHYKGGWGFHPIFCFADATGEGLARSRRGTTPVTTSHSSPDPWSCAPTGPGARTASCGPLGPATSGSLSWPAQMPRSMRRSSTPSAWRRSGSRHCTKTGGRRGGRARQDHAGPRPCRAAHRAPEGLGTLGLPLL